MKKSLLVTFGDQNYINQLKQLFSSIYYNAGWEGDYMLISFGISNKDLGWFKKRRIIVRKCKKLSFDNQLAFPSVYACVFEIFKKEFKKWENIVFIEGDIIVRSRLNYLSNIEGFGAINDVFNKHLRDQFLDFSQISSDHKFGLRKKAVANKKSAIKARKELKEKYDLGEISFNAGVMAFNTKIIKGNTYEELLDMVKKYQDISVYGMQGVLNLYFHKKWKSLPFVYNIYANYPHSNPSVKISPKKVEGAVLHFASTLEKEKPWNRGNYFYKEWKENLNKAEQIEDFNKYLDARDTWSWLRINKLFLYYKMAEYKTYFVFFLFKFKVRLSKLRALVRH